MTHLEGENESVHWIKKITFTNRQVVAPLCLASSDIAVDFIAADQLVPLSAPEGQHAANGHTCPTLHVEGTPARWQGRNTGQTWSEGTAEEINNNKNPWQ